MTYLDTIFRISDKYLRRTFNDDQLSEFKHLCRDNLGEVKGRKATIDGFINTYFEAIKQEYQARHPFSSSLDEFLHGNVEKTKAVWGDCLDVLRVMRTESVQLMITSPPYYNAREYSQWENLDSYLSDMDAIITEAYRVLDNHRPFVFNIGDVFDNDHRHTRSSWGKRRIPLGAYFTQIFEDAGFTFVDDFIWDKGEVQTSRHKNGDTPYPLYQYPINCYEHIFVFYKHRKDDTLYPCPVCGCLKVNGNAYSGVGIKSWECKNLECSDRSKANRGKRFSVRHYTMNGLKQSENVIPSELLSQWRRDIVKFPPVIKTNSKGENIEGHSAPFPNAIPEYAIKVFSGYGEAVLDPFAGTFTTAIEATRLGRNGIGIEVAKDSYRDAFFLKLNQRLPGVDSMEEDYYARS